MLTRLGALRHHRTLRRRRTLRGRRRRYRGRRCRARWLACGLWSARGRRYRTRFRTGWARRGARRCRGTARAGFDSRCAVPAGSLLSLRGERVTQLAHHRCFHGGGRRLHILAEVSELPEYFFTGDTELLRELVHAGLACHCSPHCWSRRQSRSTPVLAHVHGCQSFTAAGTCRVDLLSALTWRLDGSRRRVRPRRTVGWWHLRLAPRGRCALRRCRASPRSATPARRPGAARRDAGTRDRGATTHPVRDVDAADPGPESRLPPPRVAIRKPPSWSGNPHTSGRVRRAAAHGVVGPRPGKSGPSPDGGPPRF